MLPAQPALHQRLANALPWQPAAWQPSEVPSIVIITSCGPDPDNLKAVLIAAIMHKAGKIKLLAIVANGGAQPLLRARLIQCMLDHLNVRNVPIGIGSAGERHVALGYEYALDNFASTSDASLSLGPDLLRRTLESVPDKSIRWVLLASMRDFADMTRAHAALVASRTESVSICGGMASDERAWYGWVADYESAAIEADRPAAEATTHFCFTEQIQMTVVSERAVAPIPLQLARSFAERTECPVMHYLADAQFLGLVSLWRQVCTPGRLPKFCSKMWFFRTHCSIDSAEFIAQRYAQLGADADIVPFLDGSVKPHAVVTLMTALPEHSELFHTGVAAAAVVTAKGVAHRFILRAEHAVDPAAVLDLLRDAYLAAARETSLSERGSFGSKVSEQPSRLQRLSRLCTRSADGARASSAKRSAVEVARLPPPSAAGAMDAAQAEAVLGKALEAANARGFVISHLTGVIGLVSLLVFILVGVLDRQLTLAELDAGYDADPKALNTSFFLRWNIYSLLHVICVYVVLLSLGPSDSQRLRLRGVMVVICLVAALGIALIAPLVIETLQRREGTLYARAANALNLVRMLAVLVFMTGALALRWRSAHGLLRSLWICAGLFVLLDSLMRFFMCLNSPTAVPPGILSAIHVCIGLCSLVPSTRQRLQAAIARAFGTGGLVASLAPLLGFGSSAAPVNLSKLCRGAARVFAPVVLDDDALERIRSSRAERAQQAWSSHRRHRSAAAVGVVHLDAPIALCGSHGHSSGLAGQNSLPTVAADASGGGLSAEAAAGASEEAPIIAPDLAPHGKSPRRRDGRVSLPRSVLKPTLLSPALAPTDGARTHRQRREDDAEAAAQPAVKADAYIVHSAHDEPARKAHALSAWALTFEKEHNRRPLVWISTLCEDVSLTPAEALKHTLLRLAFSSRLVVLAGPHLTGCLQSVAQIYAWFALGRSRDSMSLHLLAHDATETRAIVSTIDTFHVEQLLADARVLALAPPAGATRAKRESKRGRAHAQHAEIYRRLRFMVELGTPRRFSKAIRELMIFVNKTAVHSLDEVERTEAFKTDVFKTQSLMPRLRGSFEPYGRTQPELARLPEAGVDHEFDL